MNSREDTKVIRVTERTHGRLATLAERRNTSIGNIVERFVDRMPSTQELMQISENWLTILRSDTPYPFTDDDKAAGFHLMFDLMVGNPNALCATKRVDDTGVDPGTYRAAQVRHHIVLDDTALRALALGDPRLRQLTYGAHALTPIVENAGVAQRTGTLHVPAACLLPVAVEHPGFARMLGCAHPDAISVYPLDGEAIYVLCENGFGADRPAEARYAEQVAVGLELKNGIGTAVILTSRTTGYEDSPIDVAVFDTAIVPKIVNSFAAVAEAVAKDRRN